MEAGKDDEDPAQVQAKPEGPGEEEEGQGGGREARPRQESKESKEASPDKPEGDEGREGGERHDKKKSKGSSSAKLAFLEQKYKEVYAENAARKEEVDRLAALVTDFLKEIDVVVSEGQDYQLGDVEAFRSAYVDGWVRYRKKAEVELRKRVEEARAREKQLEEQVAAERAEGSRKKELGAQEARDQAGKTIKNLEDLSAKLQRDYSSLLGVLKAKEGEIAEVRKSNLELSNKAADSLMDRFEKLQQSDLGSKLERSTKLDDVIRLKNELDQAHERIAGLEQQVSMLSQRRAVASPGGGQGSGDGTGPHGMDRGHSEKGTQTPRGLVSSSKETEEGSLSMEETPPAKKYERLEERLRREMSEKQSQEEESSKQYLKNLVVKYIIYEARRNEDECRILRRAILDCLQVDSSDRATIDDAISNRGGLKDSFYFLKMFGGGS